MIQTNRRGFLTGLISFAATAPAIVRAASLMPVKADRLVLLPYWEFGQLGEVYGRSPMMDALPDSEFINSLKYRIAGELALKVQPATRLPNSMTYVDGWASLRMPRNG